MVRSLEDPTFAARVESVETDLAYRVEFGGKSTETYHVKVFEYPELVRADAKLVFPKYTQLEPRTVEDIRHVTAVEGTELTLLCRLNKEVATAELVDAQGAVDRACRPRRRGARSISAKLTLADPVRLKLRLVDKEGRSNKLTSEIVINVTRNHPPVVKMIQPAHDVRVSPVEELKLKADVEDDFGVTRHGLSYSLAGGENHEIELKAPANAHRQIHAEQLARVRGAACCSRPVVTYYLLGRGRRARRAGPADDGRHVLCRGPALRGDIPAGRAATGLDRPRTRSNRRAARQRPPIRPACGAPEGDHQRDVEAGAPRDAARSRPSSLRRTARC